MSRILDLAPIDVCGGLLKANYIGVRVAFRRGIEAKDFASSNKACKYDMSSMQIPRLIKI